MQRREKSKRHEGGVFHRQNGYQKICFDECYDICFLNICEKHPLVGENCFQSLKNCFTNISPFFGCCRVAKYPVFKFTFTFRVFLKLSMTDNHSFRPPQMYLEYLDTDKMRSKADKSIWNIWTRKKWEAKLKILNEMQMLHLPLKLSHSAMIICDIYTVIFNMWYLGLVSAFWQKFCHPNVKPKNFCKQVIKYKYTNTNA